MSGDTFWVPLTFGTRSDPPPTTVDAETAFAVSGRTFRLHERAFMGSIRIKHFLRLEIVNSS